MNISTTTKISLITPTRGRPDKLYRMWESVMNTANEPHNINLNLYIDDDDTLTQFSVRELEVKYPQQIKYVIGPRIVLAQMHNEIWNICDGELLQFAGDDVVFRTKNWDIMLRDAFAQSVDKIILAYGDDGYWGPNFSTHSCIHQNWAKAVGYATPPYFSADWSDTWIFEVATQLNRLVYLPILIEHMHVSWNKAEMDDTYRDNFYRTKRDNTAGLYQDMYLERMEDVNKLSKFIENYKTLVK